MRCGRGYLSGARCKWFAYGPAEAIATSSSLASLKSTILVSLFGESLNRLSWKKRPLNVCLSVCLSVCLFVGRSEIYGRYWVRSCKFLLTSTCVWTPVGGNLVGILPTSFCWRYWLLDGMFSHLEYGTVVVPVCDWLLVGQTAGRNIRHAVHIHCVCWTTKMLLISMLLLECRCACYIVACFTARRMQNSLVCIVPRHSWRQIWLNVTWLIATIEWWPDLLYCYLLN